MIHGAKQRIYSKYTRFKIETFWFIANNSPGVKCVDFSWYFGYFFSVLTRPAYISFFHYFIYIFALALYEIFEMSLSLSLPVYISFWIRIFYILVQILAQCELGIN